MKRTDEEQIKVSLLNAIQNWWDGDAQELKVDGFPYIGGDTFAQMANAALAVLIAAGDIEESMRRDGLLKD